MEHYDSTYGHLSKWLKGDYETESNIKILDESLDPQKLIEKVRKMIPDRKIGPDSSQKPKIPAKPKKSVNTSTPLEMLQTDDDADDLPLDELPILVPLSSPIEKVPTMVYECPLCLKDHPPAQDLFSNCDTSDMIEIPELETFMPKF